MASKLSIRKAQVHVPDTCAWCDSVQDVNWYCNDCQEALCDKCKETHQRARRTRNDDVVLIKQANKQGDVVLPEAAIDSIVTSVLAELSSLLEEEDKLLKQDCLPDETKVTKIKQLIRELEQQSENPSGKALFELTGKLRTSVPLYDVTEDSKLPCPFSFVTGRYNTEQLHLMIGHIKKSACSAKKEVNSQHVRTLSAFHVTQKCSITSICCTDDTRAWIAAFGSKNIIQVDNKGIVTETVKLDSEPRSLAFTYTTNLLMTRRDISSLIHKLTKDKQVRIFADVSPLIAWNISVSENEVFVSTDKATILVLNTSGKKVRQLSVGQSGNRFACLTGGYIAAITGGIYRNELIITNQLGEVIHTWSGELENGQKLSLTKQNTIACDRYDRVFVPDIDTNQVYVISTGSEKQAKSFLDKEHGVESPTSVCVDKCGHIWIGCVSGRVHVVHL
ncbi:uncharacterized protein LOC117332972 [Pecten maximus]|uniref:uncharacterized protein LOC117332972 n=1 Tax=Pecten maximus TaxID=6579 RepID=UPI001458C863|nr:uncharacterized protein LOC117332972 [Pecten maximus]